MHSNRSLLIRDACAGSLGLKSYHIRGKKIFAEYFFPTSMVKQSALRCQQHLLVRDVCCFEDHTIHCRLYFRSPFFAVSTTIDSRSLKLGIGNNTSLIPLEMVVQ